MSKKPEVFMKRAIELSLTNMRKGQGGPFGAVVVKDGKIIGEGWNKVLATNDPTAHAEVEAIRAACKLLETFELKGCEIFTSCEPCPMCLSAIYWARLDRVYYANTRTDAAKINFDDDFLYQEVTKPVDKRKLPMVQISRDQALVAFAEWDKKADKTPY